MEIKFEITGEIEEQFALILESSAIKALVWNQDELAFYLFCQALRGAMDWNQTLV